ncbi:hypothetical protein FB379_1314 [Aeribacillus composti]|nr:hypothetical protein FB379_1314 [Aeribacillus composti]
MRMYSELEILDTFAPDFFEIISIFYFFLKKVLYFYKENGGFLLKLHQFK